MGHFNNRNALQLLLLSKLMEILIPDTQLHMWSRITCSPAFLVVHLVNMSCKLCVIVVTLIITTNTQSFLPFLHSCLYTNMVIPFCPHLPAVLWRSPGQSGPCAWQSTGKLLSVSFVLQKWTMSHCEPPGWKSADRAGQVLCYGTRKQ